MILRKYIKYFSCNNNIVVTLFKVLYVFRNHTDIFIAFRCLLFASKKHKRSYVDSDMGAVRLARS